MSEEEGPNVRLVRRTFQRLFRLVLDWTVDWILWLIVRPRKGLMPDIADPILLCSATELARKIRTGQVSSESVVQSYTRRILSVNPLINAVVDQRFQEALREAREVDLYLRTSGKSREELAKEKPLLGVPFTVKGNLACKGLALDAGLLIRKGQKALVDADVVQRMRESGAIVLALTNLPEMAMSFGCHNWVHGRTRNPFDLSTCPGGSSGGEAALLTSSGSVLGLGNDLLGSLRIPACLNGIFSHKPTGGAVSSEGVYPYVEEALRDVVCMGPMCRYAEDLRPTLSLLAKPAHNKLRLDEQVDLRKIKIYFNDDGIQHPVVPRIQPEVRAAVHKAVAHLEKVTNSPATKIRLSQMAHGSWMFATLTSDRVKRRLRSYLADNAKEEVDVVPEFLKSVFGLSKHTFFPMMFCVMELLIPKKGSKLYGTYQSMHDKATKFLTSLLKDKEAVWILPSFPQPGLHQWETTTKYHALNYFSLFNILGLPVTQVPMGLSRTGFPVGLQVVGGKYNDRLTIAVAEELEKAFGGWVNPSSISIDKKLKQ